MLVANSFDLWQKDTFFSAAEEVQQSADIMESAYRSWHRARIEGLIPQHLNELERELQMALGTAKWQLEEFEKAIRQSYRNQSDDITITRHRQFVSAMEDQISHVETALRESFNMEGKKPFRWVNLNAEECDDLALFLSGTPGTSQSSQDEGIKLGAGETSSFNKKNNMNDHSSLGSTVTSKGQNPNEEKSREEILTSNEDANCFIEQEERKFQEVGNGVGYQSDRVTSNRRTWNSPDSSTLEIVIDSQDTHENTLIEATPKEKGSRPFWRPRYGDHPIAKGAQLKIISWINQRLRGSPRSQRQQQLLPVLPVHSVRYVLVLMLTVFLIVPFLLYST